MVKGRGKHQIGKTEKSILSILKVLSDGKEHRYTEIKQKSGSNDPTLQKYFKEFTEVKLVKKRVDITSGKYPYPAYYSINPNFEPLIKIVFSIEQEKQELKKIISDSEKTPLDVLCQINSKNNDLILHIIKEYTKNNDVPQKLVTLILEWYVWRPYRILTLYLVEESKKTIGNFSVDELLRRNKTTVGMDRVMLSEISGWTGKQLDKFYEKIGRSDLVGE
jgi:predicted transcriptional regulator